MRTTGGRLLVLTLFAVAIMATSDVSCVLGDQELAASNSATGYVPNVWTQTTHADFLRGSAAGTQVSIVADSVALRPRYTDPGVYVLVGGTSTALYRFNATSGAWTAMAPIPRLLSDGSAMVYDGSGHIYALAGGSSGAVYRYDVLTNAWALFATAPGSAGSGGDITWDGTYLYVMGGTNGRQVWRLNIASLTWMQITTTPNTMGTGASILYVDGSLYVIRGGSTTTFWRYTLATGVWSTMRSTASRVEDGSDLIAGPGGALYVSQATNGRQLASYNIATNRWTSLSSQPNPVSYGGGLTYGGSDIIYSINGDGQRYFYSYNRTINSWGQLAMLPVAVNSGGCLVHVPPVLIGYPSIGTLTSETLDTGSAGMRFVQAFWDRTVPASTAVSLEVRVSDSLSGGAPAEAWTPLGSGSSGSMAGLAGRYVQWRVTLTTSDHSVSPQLEEVRLYYYRA